MSEPSFKETTKAIHKIAEAIEKKTKTDRILEAVADLYFAWARIEKMRGPMERHNQRLTVDDKVRLLCEAWAQKVKDGGDVAD